MRDATEMAAEIVRMAGSPEEGWERLLDLAQEGAGRPAAGLLRGLSPADDVERLRRELGDVLRAEPVPLDVDALVFSITHAIDMATRETTVGLCVSGIDGYQPHDPDCLCDPVYLPTHRFLTSRLLEAVDALAHADRDNAAFYQHALSLGAAGLLVRFAADGLDVPTELIVGFPAGDSFPIVLR